jgi:hypothetical protein
MLETPGPEVEGLILIIINKNKKWVKINFSQKFSSSK